MRVQSSLLHNAVHPFGKNRRNKPLFFNPSKQVSILTSYDNRSTSGTYIFDDLKSSADLGVHERSVDFIFGKLVDVDISLLKHNLVKDKNGPLLDQCLKILFQSPD